MAVTLTGTPVTVTTSGGSITIPSDATAVYMLWAAWGSESNTQEISAATIGGVSYNQSYSLGDSAYHPAIGVLAWYSPSTGSQTLSFTWAQSVTAGPVIIVAFVKGGDLTAWRDVDADQCISDTDPISVALASTSSDLVIKLNANYSTTPGTSTGWTSQQTHSNNNVGSRLSSCNSPGSSSTVCDGENENYGSLIAVSIPEGTGGSSGNPWYYYAQHLRSLKDKWRGLLQIPSLEEVKRYGRERYAPGHC